MAEQESLAALKIEEMKRLGRAVISQAMIDANAKRSSYNRDTARCFLMGEQRWWRESLEYWCDVASVDIKRIMRESREKWKR